MTITRGKMLDRVAGILGDPSAGFRAYLETSLDNQLFALWEKHDWEFRHQIGTFDTVASQEIYDLSTSIPSIRSSQDIEFMYDTTNGRKITKMQLREIKRRDPQEDSEGDPSRYAPWGSKTIHLDSIPDSVITLKLLFLGKPVLPTQDSDDLEAVCGIPDYMQHILEKMVLMEGMLWVDETRYAAMINYFEKVLLPDAIKADMKHLESGARFKFWEEELYPTGTTFDDFLRGLFTFDTDNYY